MDEIKLGGVLEFLVGPLRDRLYDAYFNRRAAAKEICRDAVSRIRKERGNFEHIVKGEGYSGESHRRAVEQYSFELLRESMNKLSNLRKFGKGANLIIQHIDKRDAASVLRLINQLEPKLTKFGGN